MDRIRIGQIGVGHAHAAGKMAAYRESDEYEVVGVVEPDPQLRAAAQRSSVYKDLRWMSSEELLNYPKLKAVAVETNVKDLLAAAEKSVAAGMHIHLDKPAGSSLPRFRKILSEASRKHLLVQMGYMYRYNPAIVFLRDSYRKGWLGKPFELHTVMSKVVAAPTRRTLSKYPGGIMFELGCHIIDLAVFFLGKPSSVVAYRQHVSPAQDTLVDNMLAVLTYPKALATVKSSAQEVEGFARRHFVLCGDQGTCHVQPLDAPDVWLALSEKRGDLNKGVQEIKFGNYRRYVADAADMARIIRGEKDSDYSYEHDELVQETILRASGLPVD